MMPVRVLVYDSFGRLHDVVEINYIDKDGWNAGWGGKTLTHDDDERLTTAIVEAYEARPDCADC